MEKYAPQAYDVCPPGERDYLWLSHSAKIEVMGTNCKGRHFLVTDLFGQSSEATRPEFVTRSVSEGSAMIPRLRFGLR